MVVAALVFQGADWPNGKAILHQIFASKASSRVLQTGQLYSPLAPRRDESRKPAPHPGQVTSPFLIPPAETELDRQMSELIASRQAGCDDGFVRHLIVSLGGLNPWVGAASR
jgi:hypothetical protein